MTQVKGWPKEIDNPKKCVAGAGGIELTGTNCLSIKRKL